MKITQNIETKKVFVSFGGELGWGGGGGGGFGGVLVFILISLLGKIKLEIIFIELLK